MGRGGDTQLVHWFIHSYTHTVSPTLLLLLAWLAASVSCMGAVVAWLNVTRGGDKQLKADVGELAVLVERIAQTERRERMSRVRKAQRNSENLEIPPGAEDIPLAGTSAEAVTNSKDELRRRVLAARGISRS